MYFDPVTVISSLLVGFLIFILKLLVAPYRYIFTTFIDPIGRTYLGPLWQWAGLVLCMPFLVVDILIFLLTGTIPTI